MVNNSSLMTSHNITNSENHELDSLEFVVEGILIPVLTFLGLVGNILSITVLHSPGVDMKVNKTVIISDCRQTEPSTSTRELKHRET